MAMTLRLPEELDARLDELARRRHLSKHALVVEAVDQATRAQIKTADVLAAVDDVSVEYAVALRRLEDA